MLNYDDLSRILRCSESVPDASRCHGFLCGRACAGDPRDQEPWRHFLDSRLNGDMEFDACYEQMHMFAADVRAQLNSPGFEFQLLLPDDDYPLTRRVDALRAWCEGFLNGVGLDGALDDSAFSDDCREVLEDLQLICQVDVDQIEVDDGEALQEVIEYVRVAAVTLFEDLRQVSISPEPEFYH